jgi:Fe-S-cluster containining protein
MPATILPLYTRTGSCQPEQCGAACCRFFWLEVNPVYLANADAAAWVRLHGIELVEHAGRTLARLPLACTALDAQGRCSIYGQPERPAMCDAFPVTPASLLGVEAVCTYTFREAEHGNGG